MPQSRRLAALLSLALLLLATAATPPLQALAALPHRVRLLPGQERELVPRLPIPLYVRTDGGRGLRVNGRPLPGGRWWPAERGAVALEAPRVGRYRVEVRALRVLPIRRVTVDVVPPLSVVVGGQSVGVIVDPGGVVVVQTWPVTDTEGRDRYPARDAGVRPGDIIVSIDGEPVRDKEAVALAVGRAGERGATVTLGIRRGEEALQVPVRPVYDRERRQHLIGLWVRDGATGIGTLTFYDPDTARYGALGHLVTDSAGEPYRIASGSLVEAYISGVRPGRPGAPGEKIGVFLTQGQELGSIERNTPLGIFGRLRRVPPGRGRVPVALEGEVRTGPARLVTVVRGREPEAFDVVIERVFPQGRPADKGMVVRVTDPRLLMLTGGIVQGMSGSPILQDGRLVGAVTHVFVNDPTRGYAVFAEWMAREALPGAGDAARPVARTASPRRVRAALGR